MTRGRALFVVLAGSALAGCAATQPVSLAPPTPPPSASDYKQLLANWTRHGDIRFDFDNAFGIDATFHSPEFQEGYAAKWAEVYKLEPPEAGRVRAQLLAAISTHYEFFVDTATHTYALNDLSSLKTIWRICLRDEQGHETVASEIVSAKEQRELLTAFYPYVSTWGRGWRVRFPQQLADQTPLIPSSAKEITLRIAGPPGSIDLTWKLR